ncbi:GGDEF domain-containing protein [Nitrosomonas sp. PY1]|uniref:bifunctional diguanylate cyclase/phosphodiesterase n=1 Tax=Nitrosomonas sp. PY1 TaxID=1803906 RepID=UPI001FC7D20E|nr:EAL domain-containing protein [Nitrosomonas sp. PY1]GKS70331.1 GGDEF domain-containing protein [Nitrosomonas sp. PY1]
MEHEQYIKKSLPPHAMRILLLASFYFTGGYAGLCVPYVSSSITLFWPPSGIALAALLLWGVSCWPGVFAGALVTNLLIGDDLTPPVAMAIALGNTTGPILGAILLKEVMGFKNNFLRGRDVTIFLLIGPGCMLLTASIGVSALYTGGILSFDLLSRAWIGWWLGDTVGVLVFTPLLLFLLNDWRTRILQRSQSKREFISVLVSCICLTWLIFDGIPIINQLMLPLTFLVFPPLIWAGLRLSALETFVVVLAIASIAIIGTAEGVGPFSREDFQLSQLILCTFIATITFIAFMMIGIQANQRKVKRQLHTSESRLRLALEAANQGLYDLNVRTGKAIVSPEYARMLGYNPQSFIETSDNWFNRIYPGDRRTVCQIYSKYISGLRKDYQVEFRQLTQQGKWKWILSLGKVIEWDSHGRPARMLGTHTDISDRKTKELALQQSEEELRVSERHQRELRVLAEREQSRMDALLSAMSIGILFEDNQQRVEYVNPAFLRMWGISEHENLLNKPTSTILECSRERLTFDHASKHMLNVPDTQEISKPIELELSNGQTLTQLSYPVADIEGQVIGRLWLYENITLERQTAQQLLYLAERDPLTGLYNRHRFQEELNNLIASSFRNQQKFALLYFDLDDFKYINDTFGHRAGDTVLIRAVGVISSIIRHIEVFARLGGDEFAILSHLQSDDDLDSLPSRIVTSVSSIPLHFRETNIRLTTSVGVAVFPEHGETAEDLIAHADTAMYQAKNQGKNTWAIYDPQRDSSEAMINQMTWYSRITQALEQNLFIIHFQGVYETTQNTLTHLEILIRMRDVNEPEHLIMPGQFIPIAEKNGQIVNIDRWVIKRSIELLSENPVMPAVAINISGKTFDDPSIPQYIRSLLSERHVDPARLIIELTETAAVSDIQDAQRFIEAIHRTGCSVCLDDFGSGFSTFGYLKYLGVEILKIDGLFIRDLPNNYDNQIFVKAMVEVARGLGKLTVAEFVEDAATLSMVKNLGIDLAQGYYLGRPGAEIPIKPENKNFTHD